MRRPIKIYVFFYDQLGAAEHSSMWAQPPWHTALVASAEALDVTGVRAALETEGFQRAWLQFHSVRDAATGAARAATRVGDRASVCLTPEADAALRQIIIALQAYGAWSHVETCVLRTLEGANITEFNMPSRAAGSSSSSSLQTRKRS